MALMERVATLLRADINHLMERAEDPETMHKQLVMDMENQLLQLKTQVAITLADQHLLEKKTREQENTVARWHRKAELAVSKGDDPLARAALERALNHETMLAALRTQVADQTGEAEALRATYTKLQSKLAETRTRCDLLLAPHRRAGLTGEAKKAQAAAGEGVPGAPRVRSINRRQSRIGIAEPQNRANKLWTGADSLDRRLAQLERDDRVEQLLTDLKSKQGRLRPTG